MKQRLRSKQYFNSTILTIIIDINIYSHFFILFIICSPCRECPEECKEAVPSLMFAAARFADLPELRDLRSLFAERYGHSLEAHVNQEVSICNLATCKKKSSVSYNNLLLHISCQSRGGSISNFTPSRKMLHFLKQFSPSVFGLNKKLTVPTGYS